MYNSYYIIVISINNKTNYFTLHDKIIFINLINKTFYVIIEKDSQIFYVGFTKS